MILNMNPKSLFHVHHVTRGHWPHNQKLSEQLSKLSKPQLSNKSPSRLMSIITLLGITLIGSLAHAQVKPTEDESAKTEAKDKVKAKVKTQADKQVTPQSNGKVNRKRSANIQLRPTFSEDGPAPLPNGMLPDSQVQKSNVELQGWQLQFNGYARLPLMIADGIGGNRRPYLIDDQYFLSGFAYTRVNEREWTELFLSASKGSTRMVVGLFSSELSDWAQAEQPKGQKGIATAFLDHSWQANQNLKIDARVGVFWERLGYLDAYDTYLFARTHIGGARLKLEAWEHFYLRVGMGAHQGDPVRERGFTPMKWAVAGVKWGGFDLATYWIRTSTQDGDYDSGELQDVLKQNESFIEVYGADLYAAIPRVGQLSLGVSYIDAANTLFLGNAHELLHTSGGGVNGLKSRYFGGSGTGEILALSVDFKWRLHKTFKGLSRGLTKFLGQSELRLFGLSAHVVSYGQDAVPDQNFHDRQWLKWGTEFSYRPQQWLKGYFLSFRFDRVILDADYEALAFRVLNPRLGFSPLPNIDIFMGYAFYKYGDQIKLDSAQLRNDAPTSYRNINGAPDESVFKLQAQARW